MAPTRGRFVPAACVLAAVACADGGDYALVVEPSGVGDDLCHIEVVLGAPCAEQPPGGPFEGVVQGIELGSETSPPVLGKVEPGTYGVVGRGFSCSCVSCTSQVVAWGCRDHELEAGGEGEIRLRLGAMSDGPAVEGCCEAESRDAGGREADRVPPDGGA